MVKAPISIGALRRLIKELQAADDREPIAIGGATEIARTLERELTRGGDPAAVRFGAPQGAALYVHIATGADEAALRGARRARVPIVAVAFADARLPYVLATDLVRVGPGERMPVDRIAAAVAARLGESGAPLAGRLPALRGAVCDRIVASFARKNGIVGAAVFVPGADLPVLALNQVRMLLLLDQAYGLLDRHVTGDGWVAGPAFTLADCAAAPALFYARVVQPWDEERLASLSRYFNELTARPSVARVVDEAREHRHLFPMPWPDHVA